MGRDNGTEITTVPRLLSRLIDQIFLSPVIRLSILACTVNSACYEYHFNCFDSYLARIAPTSTGEANTIKVKESYASDKLALTVGERFARVISC